MDSKVSSFDNGYPSLASLLTRVKSSEKISSQTRRRISSCDVGSDRGCDNFASPPFSSATSISAIYQRSKTGDTEPIAPLPFYRRPAANKTTAEGDAKAYIASKIKAASACVNSKKRVLQVQHPQEFVLKYEVTKPVIAKGSTCYVMEVKEVAVDLSAVMTRDDGSRSDRRTADDRYACKVVDATKMSAPSRPSPDCEIGVTIDTAAEGMSSLEDVTQEFDMLRKLGSHPGILKLHDVIWSKSKDKCYIVTALANGGNLQTRLSRCGIMDEEEVKTVMRQIFDALAHLHEKGIVHRDLKLENIFIQTPLLPSAGHSLRSGTTTRGASVKIGDFGMAKFLQHAHGSCGEHTICGSPQSAAPEMLSPPQVCQATGKKVAAYGHGVDMWACGVMMYTMLSGKPPFKGEGIMDLFRSIKYGKVDLDSYVWPIVSDEAKALLLGLLARDPKERLSARESLNHPWIVLDC